MEIQTDQPEEDLKISVKQEGDEGEEQEQVKAPAVEKVETEEIEVQTDILSSDIRVSTKQG